MANRSMLSHDSNSSRAVAETPHSVDKHTAHPMKDRNTKIESAGIDLLELKHCIERRNRTLRFPPTIETAFTAYTERYRARLMRSVLLWSMLIYNLFLLIDYLLLPGTFKLAFGLHLAIVTPLLIAIRAAVQRWPARAFSEPMTACVPLMFVIQIMLIFSINSSSAASQYQYLSIMILVYMNVDMRLSFRTAAGSSFILTGIYLGFLLPGPTTPMATKIVGGTSIFIAASLTLIANWRLERDTRYAFIRRLYDQTQREKAEEFANRDALTGLANRHYLDTRIKEIYLEAQAEATPTAVLMIDVDYFKAFNDRYGHPAGDLCLKRVAGAIMAEMRSIDDMAVRYGGEEFLVVLPNARLHEALRAGERIRRAVEKFAIPNERRGKSHVVTVSVGVVADDISCCQQSELIDGADEALYKAKHAGRNTIFPPFVR